MARRTSGDEQQGVAETCPPVAARKHIDIYQQRIARQTRPLAIYSKAGAPRIHNRSHPRPRSQGRLSGRITPGSKRSRPVLQAQRVSSSNRPRRPWLCSAVVQHPIIGLDLLIVHYCHGVGPQRGKARGSFELRDGSCAGSQHGATHSFLAFRNETRTSAHESFALSVHRVFR